MIDQLLNDKGSLVHERRALWPYWLILALLLNFVELALRKGFFERLTSGWGRRNIASMASSAGVSSTATLGCVVFPALNKVTQPRVAMLLSATFGLQICGIEIIRE